MSTLYEFYQERYARPAQVGAGPETEGSFARRAQRLLAAIGPAPCRVLDFGCNVGTLAVRLVAAGHTVTGVDISASAIRRARIAVPGARFEQIDSEARMPFPGGVFDVCVCTEVIEHLFAVREFLREVHRVLADEGRLVLTTPYHGWLKNFLIISGSFERHFPPTGGHIRFFSRRSLTDCLEREGFTVETVRGIGRPWPLWKSMVVTARKAA